MCDGHTSDRPCVRCFEQVLVALHLVVGVQLPRHRRTIGAERATWVQVQRLGGVAAAHVWCARYDDRDHDGSDVGM